MENDTDVMMDVYLTRDQREAYERLRKDAARYRAMRSSVAGVVEQMRVGAAYADPDERDSLNGYANDLDAAMNGANV